jgi:hypothetical protein
MARKKKPMNQQRRLRETEKAMAAGETPKARNPVALAMILQGRRGGSHGDARKQASRKACRGRVAY